jgi:hypothetical protein
MFSQARIPIAGVTTSHYAGYVSRSDSAYYDCPVSRTTARVAETVDEVATETVGRANQGSVRDLGAALFGHLRRDNAPVR